MSFHAFREIAQIISFSAVHTLRGSRSHDCNIPAATIAPTREGGTEPVRLSEGIVAEANQRKAEPPNPSSLRLAQSAEGRTFVGLHYRAFSMSAGEDHSLFITQNFGMAIVPSDLISWYTPPILFLWTGAIILAYAVFICHDGRMIPCITLKFISSR